MKIIALNKKASHDYHILETLEAGVILTGDEVKAIRQGNASINEAYAITNSNEIQLLNCHIAPYSHAFAKNDTSRRTRKLLLHRKEINQLIGVVSRKGVTLIPLKMYFNQKGYVKLLLGVAKHKNVVDKRKQLKERDIEREVKRTAKVRLR